MQQSFIVLDANRFINALKEATRPYTEKPIELDVTRRKVVQGKKGPRSVDVDEKVKVKPVTALTTERARMIVKAMLDDYMDQFLMYRSATVDLDRIVALALRDRAVATANDLALAEYYLTDPKIDDILLELIEHVHVYLHEERFGDSAWRKWTLVESGSLLGLLGGRDYRIEAWEEDHLIDDSDRNDVDINIRTLINYLEKTIEEAYPTSPILSNRISIHALVASVITRYYPSISFSGQYPDEHHRELNKHGMTEERFVGRFIHDPTLAFINVYLATKLDRRERYNGFIEDVTSRLAINRKEKPVSEQEAYFDDIRASIENGDWIPERERQEFDKYERTRRA